MKAKRMLTMLLVLAPLEAAMGQELVTGWEGGPSNGYGFVMPVFSLPKTGTNAFVIRPSVGYLYYNFSELGGFTTVRAPIASLGVAYRLRTRKATFTIGPGYEYQWEHRSLADGSTTSQNRRGIVGSGDVYYSATPFTVLTVNASYKVPNHYGWSRVGIKRQITNRSSEGIAGLSVGAEVTGQGNRDVHQVQAGALFEVGLPYAHSSLQFHSGYARLLFGDGSQQTRPYFGVGWYKAF